MKEYQTIGSCRLMNVRIIKNENVVYEGKVEDAPEDIKELKYNEIEIRKSNYF